MTRQEIDSLLAQRATARQQEDWALSDKLRLELLSCGVRVIDTSSGQIAEGGGTEYELRSLASQVSALRDKVTMLYDTLAHNKRVYDGREKVAHERILQLQNDLLAAKYA